jgi:monothiol glutaredoxin
MSDNPVFDQIKQTVNASDVVLFMKGTPVFPQCGFSAAVIDVLENVGVKFSSVNVLEDEGVREGIKAYSDWPTIPQLYVKGEFVGGCDIVREMHGDGELQKLMDDQDVEAA